MQNQTQFTRRQFLHATSAGAALLSVSLAHLRRESPSEFLKLVSGWFEPSNTRMWSNGIHALLPLIEDPAYDNLPPVYDAVYPVIDSAPAMFQNDIAELIRALYAASPVETSYFLRQTLTASSSPQAPLTFRRILPSLPAALQPMILDENRVEVLTGVNLPMVIKFTSDRGRCGVSELAERLKKCGCEGITVAGDYLKK